MSYSFNELLAIVSAVFPVFKNRGQACVPLKLGIFEDIIEAFPAIDHKELEMFFHGYCRSRRYQIGLRAGGPRFDLDGQPSGEVTPEQSAHAAGVLLASLGRAKQNRAMFMAERAEGRGRK